MSFIDRIKRILGGAPQDADAPGSPPAGDVPVSGPPLATDTISCLDAITVINDFLDGELDEVSEEQVRTHFAVCQRCYPHLKLEESFREALHRAAAARGGAPPELRARIMEVIGSESTG